MQPSDRMLPWVNEALTQLGVAVAHPAPALEQEVGTLMPGEGANVREGFKMPAHVALLVPNQWQSCRCRHGDSRGLLCRLCRFCANHMPRPPVKVYDSAGTAAGAIKAYQQAVADGAQLIIGPLTRGEVSALFGLPQLPVPLLALNHPDDKSLPASGVSEFGLLPETEGAQAADHMADNGIVNAFVIVSNDDFAQRASKSFKAELEARGGKVAGVGNLPGSGRQLRLDHCWPGHADRQRRRQRQQGHRHLHQHASAAGATVVAAAQARQDQPAGVWHVAHLCRRR